MNKKIVSIALKGIAVAMGVAVIVLNILGTLNVNTATATALQELPGVGPALAAAIVAHRRTHGPFRRREDLSSVPGMRPGTLRTIWNDIRIEKEPAPDILPPAPPATPRDLSPH